MRRTRSDHQAAVSRMPKDEVMFEQPRAGCLRPADPVAERQYSSSEFRVVHGANRKLSLRAHELHHLSDWLA
jgi:hypothetical protein